jgi:hypothetical protein
VGSHGYELDGTKHPKNVLEQINGVKIISDQQCVRRDKAGFQSVTKHFIDQSIGSEPFPQSLLASK